MKLLIASIDPEEVQRAADYGAHGIITNPPVLAAAGREWKRTLREAAGLLGGPIFLQLTESRREGMVKQAGEFRELVGERLALKICISREGLAAMQSLRRDGIPIAITAVASAMQADIAAQAGADYLALYMGRSDRFGMNGADLVGQVVDLMKIHDYPTRIIAASIQHPLHFEQAALRGAHFAASPIGPIEEALEHPITEKSIAGFLRDWESISG